MIKTEIFYVVILIIFTASMWVPYIVNRILENGLWSALKNPNVETLPKALWAQRAIRAHMNTLENIVIFVSLILIIEIFKLNSNETEFLSMSFLVLRILHYFCYLFGIPVLRTVLFFLGFIIQVRLGLIILEM